MTTSDAFLARASCMAEGLGDHGYDLHIGVPCGILAPLFAALEDTDVGFTYAPREDTAIGMAVGAWLGGRQPVVVMQNSGLGQSVNALASLVVPYAVPLAMIVSIRGIAPDTTSENQVMGALTEPLLDHMTIATRRCRDVPSDLAWLAEVTTTHARPATLLVEPSYFGWSTTR